MLLLTIWQGTRVSPKESKTPVHTTRAKAFMFDFNLPLWGAILLFAGSAATICVSGIKLADLADRFADRTGLGEAITGTVFLGLITALPGLAASVTAAIQGHPVLAISNAMGGIAFQTTVLAVADLVHRDANLEHAAASVTNMMQTIMLILLTTLVVAGLSSPDVTVLHIHPATIVMILAAGLAYWLVYRVREAPMWKPTKTSATVVDEPESGSERENLTMLIAGLLLTGSMTMLAGGLVASTSETIVQQTPLSEAVVGGLFMAGATSLPELVTCIAAVRRGALTLAVSDIVGGNFFDVLFVAAADLAYLQGSLYHGEGVGQREIFVTTLTVLLNVVLLAGLIYREKHGLANIGFESVLMLLLYASGFSILAFAM